MSMMVYHSVKTVICKETTGKHFGNKTCSHGQATYIPNAQKCMRVFSATINSPYGSFLVFKMSIVLRTVFHNHFQVTLQLTVDQSVGLGVKLLASKHVLSKLVESNVYSVVAYTLGEHHALVLSSDTFYITYLMHECLLHKTQ
jgi:hypothetical protein